MFKEISWESYWVFIALTSGIYYGLLILKFRYKPGLLHNMKQKVIWQVKQSVASSITEANPAAEEPVAAQNFLQPAQESDDFAAYACMDEINAYLEEARKTKGNKPELINSISRIVSKYPGIKETEFKESLSNAIIAQCEHMCLVHLSAADMDRVWQG